MGLVLGQLALEQPPGRVQVSRPHRLQSEDRARRGVHGGLGPRPGFHPDVLELQGLGQLLTGRPAQQELHHGERRQRIGSGRGPDVPVRVLDRTARVLCRRREIALVHVDPRDPLMDPASGARRRRAPRGALERAAPSRPARGSSSSWRTGGTGSRRAPGRETTSRSPLPTARSRASRTPASKWYSAASSRRCRIAATSSTGVRRTASSPNSAAASGAPRARAWRAAASSAWATSRSGFVIARARCRARSSGSVMSSARRAWSSLLACGVADE